MAHLTCHTHGHRAMVLQNGDILHRKDNLHCYGNRIVMIAGKDFVSFDIPSKSNLKTADNTHWRDGVPVDLRVPLNVVAGITEATKQITEQFGMMKKQIQKAVDMLNLNRTPEERLLHDIFAEPELSLVKCPVCGVDDAVKDKSQENTIYCDSCEFMGLEPSQ